MNHTGKTLWILRHGEADEHPQHDKLRELSSHGVQQVKMQAAYLVAHKISVDEIWVSPYVRAQQTAQVLLQHWPCVAAQHTTPMLEPETRPEALLKMLQGSAAQNIFLISHQPLVNCLVAYLVHAKTQGHLVESMYTAALAQLSAEEWLPGWVALNGIRQADD